MAQQYSVDTYTNLIEQAAQKYGVPVQLIRAVMQQESGGNPRITSSAGAQGLMQLMPANIKEAGVTDAFDPAQNIDAGVKQLSQYLKMYGGDIPKALAAYNMGPGNLNKRGMDLAQWPQETRQYVPQVMSRAGMTQDIPEIFSQYIPTGKPSTVASGTGAADQALATIPGIGTPTAQASRRELSSLLKSPGEAVAALTGGGLAGIATPSSEASYGPQQALTQTGGTQAQLGNNADLAQLIDEYSKPTAPTKVPGQSMPQQLSPYDLRNPNMQKFTRAVRNLDAQATTPDIYASLYGSSLGMNDRIS